MIKENLTEYFGSMVFGDAAMKKRLPEDTYNMMQRVIRTGKRLDMQTAEIVASAMKDWAIEKGATHYTHWFQPMTSVTAEKHDGFISPTKDGQVIMEFRGSALIHGESDASSFPNGGLRATFEARGYTAWDPTSYAFIKDKTLYIPTAFCSYGGEALDKRTPLLRSTEAINREALRVLRLFGHDEVSSVRSTVGPEQEYFLIDESLYSKRPDLVYTGRTLFGARAPKGQELDDHYFGTIKPRVKAFMDELDIELWKLGVLAKTEHNEAAPAQHELAPIFATVNIATDHNQLTMELMQKIARNHGLVCLLAEKPFEGVNGSGKHNNWSLSTDTGVNLLEPGETPYQNAQFLLFLTAVIKATDEYADLFRISVATPGNDHRLGANEAPPAVVSMFLGDELGGILEAIENEDEYSSKDKEMMKVGVHVLPKFPKDSTDRNRTSPFAFTGNKFEFRMLGSSNSIADANTTINTAVAKVLSEFATELEAAENFTATLNDIIKRTIRRHKRILFNGNGYGEEWYREAERRGLPNYKTTPDALAHLLDKKNVELFTSMKVFSETELRARHEILEENYAKIINIEALTMIEMLSRDILPAVSEYAKTLSDSLVAQKSALGEVPIYEERTLRKILSLKNTVYKKLSSLEASYEKVSVITDPTERAEAFRDLVIPKMEKAREATDELETMVSRDCWPYPSYGELLFGVR